MIALDNVLERFYVDDRGGPGGSEAAPDRAPDHDGEPQPVRAHCDALYSFDDRRFARRVRRLADGTPIIVPTNKSHVRTAPHRSTASAEHGDTVGRETEGA